MTPTSKPAVHCWPWSHRWTKWGMIERGELHKVHNISDEIIRRPYGNNDPIVVGHYETQRRICEKCGKSQLREVRA